MRVHRVAARLRPPVPQASRFSKHALEAPAKSFLLVRKVLAVPALWGWVDGRSVWAATR